MARTFCPDLQTIRIAQRQGGKIFSLRIDFEQGHVVALIGADKFCGIARLVAKNHFNALRFLHYVKIGEDVAAFVDDESGARAFDRDRIHEEIVLRGFGENVRYGRRGLAVDTHVDGFIVGERGVTLRKAGRRQTCRFRFAEPAGSDVHRLARAPASSGPVGTENDDESSEK